MSEAYKTMRISPESGALQQALQQAVQEVRDGVHVTVELADGVYRVTETIVLQNSGAAGRLTITAAQNARPVLSGLQPLAVDAFTQVNGEKYFVYQFPQNTDGTYPKLHDFYDNGKRVPIAETATAFTRVPYDDHEHRDNPENLKGIYVDESTVAPFQTVGGDMEFTLYLEWEFYKLHVAGVDLNDTKEVDGHKVVRLKLREKEWQEFVHNSHPMLRLNGRKYLFGNHPQLLVPDTYVYDSTVGKLYYYPKGEMHAPAVTFTETLLRVENMRNVTVKGLVFTGTACLRPAIDGYQSGQANTEMRYGVLQNAAVLMSNTANMVFERCMFEELGGNGLQSINRSNGITVDSCTFRTVAMSAIAFGNRSSEWKANWCSENANYNYVIRNNLIETIGMEFPTCPAVYIAHIDGMKMTHNTIRNVAYSGVSVGWGWSTVDYMPGESVNIRNVEIAYNCVEDYMMRLRDGGAIYVVGANCTEHYTELFNSMHHNFARRPLEKGYMGYYLDGSSSNWHVHNNVISGCYLSLFMQYNVESQYIHNAFGENIYSTEEISEKNNVPERNVRLGNCYRCNTLEELFEAYPNAKAIAQSAGCNL